MRKCIFMRGLPGSGKTTYCKDKLSSYKRFNRDEQRILYPNSRESVINDMEIEFMRENTGNDIVIDNTHLSSSLNGKIEFAKQLGYDVEVIDMYNIFSNYYETQTSLVLYLQHCLEQNIKRDSVVPECVIYEMFIGGYDVSLGQIVIVDIDGTIADLSHRLHYIKQEKKDHESFYANVSGDAPIKDIIDLANHLHEKYTIIYVSGRRNQTYRDTKKWMIDNGVKYDYILMRKGFDRRKDTDVKKDIYMKLQGHDIKFVIDDRPSVIRMWMSMGLRVLDVNRGEGDF